MKLHPKFLRRIAAGLGTATLMSVAVSGFAFWSFTRTLEANRKVQSEVALLNHLRNIVDLVRTSESGQRGYVLTANDSYLDSYIDAYLSTDREFAELRRLLADQPDSQRQLKSLQSLVDNRLSQMKEVINLRRTQGLDAAVQAIDRNESDQASHRITRLVNDMSAKEALGLSLRQQEAARNLQMSIVTFCGGVLINLGIFAWVYRLIYHEIRQRMQAEQEIQHLNDDLERRVVERTEQLEQTLQNLQRTQIQLVQGEKMSSLGQLVAGVAHEINNPVNFIHGNLTHMDEYVQDLLRMLCLYQQRHPGNDPEIQALADEVELEFLMEDLQKMLSSMKIGTDRIRQIVLSLRNFSRMDEAEFKAVNIHDGIESTLMILQHRLKARPERPEIEVIRNYDELPAVECYPGQLNQVFMNILVNALDALDEANAKRTYQEVKDNPSRITIRTAVMSDDRWVKITLADNGLGIPKEIQQRIFNPFFTTKPVGKGTGMGMSISYQIVTEKHTGQLECFSTPEAGTEFVIQIPVRQQVAAAA
jgi:signal transduction histidine kinase